MKQTIMGLFKALSLSTRMNMILSLYDGEKSVNEIARLTEMEQSHVSHHLKHLTDTKIVTCRREGKTRIYSLNKGTIEPMISLAEKHIYGAK